MRIMDEHSVIGSMEETLLSALPLIDSRTEADWLDQLTRIASLINYYNNENKITGNWQPFLMKDPVFLLASISKTNFNTLESSYSAMCREIELQIKSKQFSNPDLCENVNRLFDLLIHIFHSIRQWIYYMHFTVYDYPLKTYIVQQVRNTFGNYLWALIALRRDLFILYAAYGMEPVDSDPLHLFDYPNETVWKSNKEKEPYWDVLGIHFRLSGNHVEGIIPEADVPADEFLALTGLKKAGDDLFDFFRSIIHHSTAASNELRAMKSSFPDTVLLRAFIDTLKIQQDQLNGIAAKYFKFYYKDILQQSELPAVSDKVFICADPAKKDVAVVLPAETLFDAGVDALGYPVLFASVENANLQPATITDVYTVVASADLNMRTSLAMQYVGDTGKVIIDRDGKVRSWPTFGNAKLAGTVVKESIAFASPLLLLREGHRKIKLTLNFTAAITSEFQNTTSFYLSTAQQWVKVAAVYDPVLPGNDNVVVVSIDLDPTKSPVPPIEAFVKDPKTGLDPDGLASNWPMLRIEFDSFLNISAPPEISSLEIEVNVSGIKTLQLYNDFGLLDPKKAYQLFGPAPALNSHFVIGSNEIFSKPVSQLLMQLDWDHLPGDFSVYYKEYNENLPYVEEVQETASVKTMIKRMVSWVKNSMKRLWAMFVTFFWKEPSYQENTDANPFNNNCFTVDFDLLQNQKWVHAETVIKAKSYLQDNITLDWDPYIQTTQCHAYNTNFANQLFGTDFNSEQKKCLLSSSSFFAYTAKDVKKVQVDPSIQSVPLRLTADSTSGFMRMSLTGPEVGFGSPVYPALVSDIALKNASAIMNSDFFDGPDIKKAANPPFAPKLKDVTVHYAASAEYTFTQSNNTYPLQCYHYTPFNNYKIFDSAVSNNPAGLSLYNAFPYKGCLLIGLENIISSSDLNIYFELSPKSGERTKGTTLVYQYLSQDGWKLLPVLSDGTFGFTCSGIIRVHIPGDISNINTSMTGHNYWIQVAIVNDPAAEINIDPASFAQTVFLKANGVLLERSTIIPASQGIQPVVNAAAIQKCKAILPQLSTIVQPFPSFGGKVAEDESMMNKRIACLIKTKGRAVSSGDYFRLIKQEFNGIYYSRLIPDNDSKRIQVYVARSCNSITDPNAFIPLVSGCLLETIQQFLAERSPAFYGIVVSNFELVCVKISAELIIKTSNNALAMQKSISDALNIYLSPWIEGAGKIMRIEETLTEALLTEFIKSMDAIASVNKLSISMWKYGDETTTVDKPGQQQLLISSMDHSIKCIPENG